MKISRLQLLLATTLLINAANAGLYGKMLCKEEGYHCQKVKRGQTWRSLFKDPDQRNLVMRVNRMNTQIYAGITLAVPNNLDTVNILDLAPFPKTIDAPNEKLIVVDPAHEAWAAYESNGSIVRWGPISAGSDFCRDIDETCRTHDGEYRIYSLGSSDCHSRKFPLPDGGAPMPYCMYFNNGQALHGEPNGLPGYNASHGCVRMYVTDAEWMRYNFVEGPNEANDFRGTKVLVSNYANENPYDQADDNNDDSDSSDSSRDDNTYY